VDDPTSANVEQPSGSGHEGGDATPATAATSASAEASEHEADATPSLIEMAVFAPIDAAFALLRDPSGAATRGRARVEQALRQARAIGELSIKFGARELRRRTEGAGAHEDAAAKPSAAKSAVHPDAGPAPDDVIADYDALSASQIVPMLSSLETAERARVADYEAKSRGRQTILRRIEQLDRNGD
jgi:hypothetical protein